MDGSIERGYAGRSIFFENGHVRADLTRARAYARLLASIGINGCNVNADLDVLTTDHLREFAKLADVFRPWAVRIALSIDLSSPKTVGGLKTFDPLDPEVVVWWSRKIDEIYTSQIISSTTLIREITCILRLRVFKRWRIPSHIFWKALWARSNPICGRCSATSSRIPRGSFEFSIFDHGRGLSQDGIYVEVCGSVARMQTSTNPRLISVRYFDTAPNRSTTPAARRRLFCTLSVPFGSCVRDHAASSNRRAKRFERL